MPSNPFPGLAFPGERRLDAAVQNALEAFWERIGLHFPELTTGDADPGAHLAFEAAARKALETLLRCNNPYCTVDDPTPTVLPEDHFGYIHPDAVALIVALHAAGHPAPYTAAFHPETEASARPGERADRYPTPPVGEDRWLITPGYLRKILNLAALPSPVTGHADVGLALSDHSSFSERLRQDPSAPDWVKTWAGPFWIGVHDADGNFIDPALALSSTPVPSATNGDPHAPADH